MELKGSPKESMAINGLAVTVQSEHCSCYSTWGYGTFKTWVRKRGGPCKQGAKKMFTVAPLSRKACSGYIPSLRTIPKRVFNKTVLSHCLAIEMATPR